MDDNEKITALTTAILRACEDFAVKEDIDESIMNHALVCALANDLAVSHDTDETAIDMVNRLLKAALIHERELIAALSPREKELLRAMHGLT